MTNSVLAHPSYTRVQGAVDTCIPTTIRSNPCSRTGLERLSRLVYLDHVVTDTHGGGEAFTSRLGCHFGHNFAAALEHLFGGLSCCHLRARRGAR